MDLALHYNSDTVNPYFRARLYKGTSSTAGSHYIPDQISLEISLEGQTQTLHTDWTTDPYLINLMLKKENARGERLSTGLYQWKGRVNYDFSDIEFWSTVWFGGPPQTSTGIPITLGQEKASYGQDTYETIININEQMSPFGSGWQLEGVERVYEDPAHNGYITIGNGGYEKYNPQHQIYTTTSEGNGIYLVQTIDTLTNTVIWSYPIYGEPQDIKTSPNGKKLYIATNYSSSSETDAHNAGDLDYGYGHNIRVMDLRTGEVSEFINVSPTGSQSCDILALALNPDGTRLYAFISYRDPQNYHYNHIAVVDSTSRETLNKISFGSLNYSTLSLEVNPDGKKLYVALKETTSNALSIYSTETYAQLAYIPIYSYIGANGTLIGDNKTRSIAITPDGKKAYFLASNSYNYGYIIVIDGVTNQYRGYIGITLYPTGIDVSPDSARAYTTFRATTYTQENPPNGVLSIIETAKDQTIGQLTLGTPYPEDIAISPDGKRAYSVNNTSNTITAFDLEKLSTLTNIATTDEPQRIIYTPDGKKAYITTPNSILVLDTATNTLQSTIDNIASTGLLSVSRKNTKKLVAWDNTIITKEDDGTYTRTYKDQGRDTFDPDGYKTSSCDTHGNCTQYTMDDGGGMKDEKKLTKIIDAAGQETTFSYDTNNKLQRIEDPQGRITELHIDQDGNLTSLTLPDQSTYQFNYDSEHRITSKTTPRGYTTSYTYNDYGLIESVTSPTGEERHYTPGLMDQLANSIPGALEGE
ncbi:MAG: hypothetical protein HYS08_03445, partial [Chlamydiae bacterium]|nr:hypothetical protein [Chlamydiota bacterium]